jgi:4-hydroxybenzoate polyprenyltransferase
VERSVAVIQRVQPIFQILYLLELVGAAVVTSLGWIVCRILQVDPHASAPLWFAGYLFVYNLDRLYRDPADQINIPIRSRESEHLRPFRIGLCVLSGVTLVLWPALTGHWQLILPIALASAILQFYSRPIPGIGFRFKDLPYIKSVLAPLVIAGILVVWPCIENGKSFRLKECLIFIWCMLILAINALVFDYRDIEGDAVVGTATIPVRLGQRNSIYLLAVLALALVGVSGWFATKRFVSPLMPATPGPAGVADYF